MLSQVLRVASLSSFGQIENPLWTVVSRPQVYTWEEILSFNHWTRTLIPLESLQDIDFTVLFDIPSYQRERIQFQTYLTEREFSKYFWDVIANGHRVQIWLDRPLQSTDERRLVSLLEKTDQIDFVFVFSLRYEISEFFSSVPGFLFPRFLFHFKLKESQFDAWPDLIDSWENAIWVKETLKINQFGFQVLEDQIEMVPSADLKLFLLSPDEEKFRHFLRGY